jgi:hypothetical protein
VEEKPAEPVYVNAFSCSISPYDITFAFGRMTPEEREGSRDFRPVVRLVMSPTHAKALSQILQALLGEYEKRVGEVPVPVLGRASEEEKS